MSFCLEKPVFRPSGSVLGQSGHLPGFFQEPRSVRFEGTEGWIQIENDKPTYYPESLKTSVIGPNEIHLYPSNDHHRNFLDCIKANHRTAAPVEIGHRSVTICHLGNIAMTLKRKLRWDPVKERFINDEAANRMLDAQPLVLVT
jgi:hypothetical protein